MKKTNRLIIFALSLAIVISALVGISVSAAEDEGALEIKKINLIYGDKVELLVAVDISNEYRDNVEVTYTFDGEKYTAELHPTEVYRDENDATFPVFRTIGIAPKDIGKPMTFEAHIKDSGATGAALSASILDYLYARLYKEGYINKTEDEDIAKKNLYQNTINYASSALEVLVNYKQGKNETLYKDYVFAWGADSISKVASDRYFGAFVPGTEVTPTYAGEFEIKEWNLYDVNGEAAGTLAADTAYELNAHTKFEAVQDGGEDPVITGFENGFTSDYVHSYSKDAEGNYVSVNTETDNSTKFARLPDPTDAANTVLEAYYSAKNGADGYTKVDISNAIPQGDCYTFGTKMYIAFGSNNYNYAQIKFVDKNGGVAFIVNIGSVGAKKLYIKTTGDDTYPAKGTTLYDGTDDAVGRAMWIDLRMEFYNKGADATEDNTYLKLFINGAEAFDGIAYAALGVEIDHVEIVHCYAGAANRVYYDDIYFTRTNKEYVAD